MQPSREVLATGPRLSAALCTLAILSTLAACTDLREPTTTPGTDAGQEDATAPDIDSGPTPLDDDGSVHTVDSSLDGSAPSSTPDAQTPDCETDADCMDGLRCLGQMCTFVPPERVPSTAVQTAGGGVLTGAGLRMQLRVGSPIPSGHMSGSGNQITLGPFSSGR